MDDEQNAANHLGGLALGNVLRDLGIDQQADFQRLGLSSGQTALKREEIYNDRFSDDPLGPTPNDGKDWEQEVDDEMRKEMAQDRDSEEREALDRYYRQGMAQLEKPTTRLRGEDDDFDDDEDDEADAQAETAPQQPPPPFKIKAEPTDDNDLSLLSRQAPSNPLALPTGRPESPLTPPPPEPLPGPPVIHMDEIQRIFPDFEPSKVLNFTELFATRPAKKRRLVNKPAQFHLQPEDELPLPQSTREEILQQTKRRHEVPLVTQLAGDLLKASIQDKEEHDSDDGIEVIATSGVRSGRGRAELANLELFDWEDKIVWDGKSLEDQVAIKEANGDVQQDLELQEIHAQMQSIDRPFNHDLASGTWLQSIIWDHKSPFVAFDQLVLDMNDPQMMLEEETGPQGSKNTLLRSDAPKSAANTRTSSRGAVEVDRFNLSNDKFYEQAREHKQRVRQTLGKLVVQHAWPATKLQLPWYKTKLTKAEARSFHRPAMQFPTNMPLTFSKIRSSKKKKDGSGSAKRAKDPNEVLRSSRDLTLKETGPYVLYEYSEEYPPLLSNLGMGSLLVNYYRKKDAKDEHIPKMDIGEPYVLDVADESPFMKFGNIEAGQVQPTLYNNIIRAPLFRHKPAHTDFLLIRSTMKDSVRYYLREVKNLFAVGQTYPVQPIPGPHARLVTNNIKYRLQMIAYKLIQKSYKQRIKIHRLMRYFPDQNELQMRQRLKEFMEYNRKAGDANQGFWKLKPHIVVPEEQELFKLLPPENICLAESMQVGQRHLMDAGYTKTAEGADDDDESKMDIEQLLAPWITSKNFINATQGKAMLKLHGEGDPTGRGEAFSFIRVSMKEIFLRAGEDHDERMAQAEADAKSKSGHKYSVAEQQAVYRSEVDRIWRAQHRALSNPIPPKLTLEEERGFGKHMRAPSARADTPSEAGQDSTKVLRIRRFVHGKWHREIVRDPAVINAYVAQRKKIEDEALATEDLVPTGDESIDAARMKRLQEQLAHMKKNQERRIQRKNAKAAAEGLAIPGGYKKLLNKTDTKRRCGRCGEVGHMSTNTSCPMYSKEKEREQEQQRPVLPHLSSGGFFGAGMGVGVGGPSPMGSIPPSPAPITPGAEVVGGGAGSPPATPVSSTPTPAPAGGGLKLKLKKLSKPSQ